MKLNDIVADEKTVRVRQEVPWTDIEPLLEQAKARGGNEEEDIAHAVGWSSHVFYDWRRKNAAPKTALYVLKGYLGERIVVTHPFNLEELCDLIKVAPTKALVQKIAKEIGDVA